MPKLNKFRGRESDFADFTFEDANGDMWRALRKAGATGLKKVSAEVVTYHLEVKSTPGGCCSRPARISENQRDMVRSDHKPVSCAAILTHCR